MSVIRKVLIQLIVTAFIAFTPILLFAQNSILPLQEGQNAKEETARLTAVLQSEAEVFNKAIACKRLAVIGTKDAVNVLASLLADEKMSHYARYALEPIPDPAVDDALRSAMGKLKGPLLVGVVNSIGNRRDAKAVDSLGKLVAGSNADVAAAAAASLGRIASPEAGQILTKALAKADPTLRAKIADGCLSCAESLAEADKQQAAVALFDAVRQAELPKHVRVAATRGAILARKADGMELLVEQLNSDDKAMFGIGLRTVREMPGSDVTKVLLQQYAKAKPSPARQALLLSAIADRDDKSALPVVLQAAKTGPPEVRVPAIRALAKTGDASAVPVLMEAAMASDAALSRVALAGLAKLPGKDVDAAILAMLEKSDPEARPAVIELVGRRRIASAVPTLLKAADDSQEPIRLAAIRALGQTITLDNLSALTDRIIKPRSPEEKTAAQEALKAACVRIPDRDACAAKLTSLLPKVPLETSVFLLEVLGTVGGKTALKTVAAAARVPNDQVQDAATRVLGTWLTVDVAPELLKLSKASESRKYQVRCLRGYIRIARQFKLTDDQRLAMCREALAAAQRDQEKKLVIDVLARNPSPGSLSLAAGQLDNKGLKEAAAAAAVTIAEAMAKDEPAQVAKAMKRVIDATGNQDTAGKAKKLLKQAER